MRPFGRFVSKYSTRTKNQKLFGERDNLMATAQSVVRGHKSTNVAKRFGAKTGIYTGISTIGLSYGAHKVMNFREGLTKGIFPGSTMPMESGRFGIRTNRTPAGLSGLRFNFRRK